MATPLSPTGTPSTSSHSVYDRHTSEADLCRTLVTLQDDDEHLQTSLAVNKFLTDPSQGPRLQQKLEEYNEGVESYIEEWWYESYLSQTESVRFSTVAHPSLHLRSRHTLETDGRLSFAQVVLSLNPFFILSQSPTPAPPPPSSSSSASSSSSNHIQLKRASSLILSSLSFIHDLRHELLAPDVIRGGKKLDMSQYARLFGTARVPGGKGGCEMKTEKDSRHVVVIRRGQICTSFHFRPPLLARSLPLYQLGDTD